jgi:hypothetical protein
LPDPWRTLTATDATPLTASVAVPQMREAHPLFHVAAEYVAPAVGKVIAGTGATLSTVAGALCGLSTPVHDWRTGTTEYLQRPSGTPVSVQFGVATTPEHDAPTVRGLPDTASYDRTRYPLTGAPFATQVTVTVVAFGGLTLAVGWFPAGSTTARDRAAPPGAVVTGHAATAAEPGAIVNTEETTTAASHLMPSASACCA